MARTIKSIKADTHFIVLTGSSDQNIVGKFSELGIIDYIVKPVEFEKLFTGDTKEHGRKPAGTANNDIDRFAYQRNTMFNNTGRIAMSSPLGFQRIKVIALAVADKARAEHFYGEILGLSPAFSKET